MEKKQRQKQVANYYTCSQLQKLRTSDNDQQQSENIYTYSSKNQNKNQKKYEVVLTYKAGQTGKVKARRIRFGHHGEEDGTIVENEVYEKNRAKYEKILIDSLQFDQGVFRNAGGFFNPKFWDVNVRWGKESRETGDVADAIKVIDQKLKSL